VVCSNSEYIYNSINKIIKSNNYNDSKIFIIYDQNLSNYQFENSCSFKNLEPFEQFLLESISLNKINTQPQTQPLLNRVVDIELEKLDISKKYIGFKYLVDFIAKSLSYKYRNYSMPQIFDFVASINNSSYDTIEHDIRHLLLTNWKTNIKLKNALPDLNKIKYQPNAKTILQNLIYYIKQSI